MRIKCFYNKNLGMSPQKLAAQVAHACMGVEKLNQHLISDEPNTIVVLMATASRMKLIRSTMKSCGIKVYTQVDLGLTEVPAGTETVIAFVEGTNGTTS